MNYLQAGSSKSTKPSKSLSILSEQEFIDSLPSALGVRVKYSSGIVPYQATNLEIAEVLINDMQDKLKGVRKDPKKVLMPTRKGIRLIDQDRQKN